MIRSTRLSESPPEFFADRCLGKTTPQRLIGLGWNIHIISDYFPDDAQYASDPDWMKYGVDRGWSLLTQDARIRRQVTALELLTAASACIHCLDSSELLIDTRVERFHHHRYRIVQQVQRRKAAFYMVTATSVEKRWPA